MNTTMVAHKNGSTMSITMYGDGIVTIHKNNELHIRLTEEQFYNMLLKESIERRTTTTGYNRRITDAGSAKI